MFKLDLEKAEEPDIKLPTSIGSQKKEENSRKNIYFCFIDYTKAFDSVDHITFWKTLREMGIQYYFGLLRNLHADQHLELDMEQPTGSRQGKQYIKAVYCHPTYLTYMQSTS